MYGIHEDSVTAVRAIYNLLDLFGDLGGVLEIFFAIFAVFIEPISEHSYVLTAISRLFYARTTVQNLFQHRVKSRNYQVVDENRSNARKS